METMPFRLSSDDQIEMKCIGFGLIRGIDIERCLFYILTPIPREQLASVNVLARGANIDLPQQFILAQCSKDVPYVMHPRSLGASPILQNLNSQLVVRSGFLRSRLINQRAQRGRGSGRGR